MSDHTSTEKPTAALETAQKLQETLNKSELHIVDSQKQFDIRTTSADENIRLPLAFGEGGGLVDPASVSLDLTAQLVSTMCSNTRSLVESLVLGVLSQAEVPVS